MHLRAQRLVARLWIALQMIGVCALLLFAVLLFLTLILAARTGPH